MPTPTYTPLANLTLSGSAASVTFSSISQVYRDLRLIVSGSGTLSSSLCLRFNSDAGSNYNYVYMLGDGSAASSITSSPVFAYCGELGTTQSNIVADIMDYTATDKHKTLLSRSDVPSQYVMSIASRWANTAAINSVYVYIYGTSFPAGSTFALYGIAS